MKVIGVKIPDSLYDEINSFKMSKSDFLRFCISLGLKKIEKNPEFDDTDDFDIVVFKQDTLALLEELDTLSLELEEEMEE